MANWAVALRRKRCLDILHCKHRRPAHYRLLNRLSYQRTKVLKGRPKKLSFQERRRRKQLWRTLRRNQINERERQRAMNDPQFCIARRLRASLRDALSRQDASKVFAISKSLGCSFPYFLKYLESKFLPGMHWGNRQLWHVDHLRPLSSFDLTNPAQQLEASHYTNLQPLWARANQSKGAKYEAQKQR